MATNPKKEEEAPAQHLAFFSRKCDSGFNV
jgi:hypothetical protein